MMEHESISVLELLFRHWVAVLVIGAGVVLPIFAIIVQAIQKGMDHSHQARSEQLRAASEQELVRLKQSMIARGMTADEIERVLKAGQA
jgi:hypothetical protein